MSKDFSRNSLEFSKSAGIDSYEADLMQLHHHSASGMNSNVNGSTLQPTERVEAPSQSDNFLL